MRIIPTLASVFLITTLAAAARAETYQVGPSRTHKNLQAVQGLLKPGDVVEVDGDATYPGGVFFRAAQSGSVSQKITIRGVKVNGKRPVISGGGSGAVAGIGMVLNGNHYVLESLSVTASANICVVHKGDDITIRDFVVFDCPRHGLLGHDDEAGSLTLEHSEFYGSGNETFEHQIYMTTGQQMYPGSIFRMQHCYVHDGRGGNNVKSRAERNEIYYNWIEGAFYHNLELIGADKSPATPAREDGDIVGNVIVGNGSESWHLLRLGGDKDEADTSGRYRLVNNTFVVGAKGAASVVRLMLRVDTVEMHNNAFVRLGAGNAPLFEMDEVQWMNGASLFGSNNWVQDGFTAAPGTWTNTMTGADPGLMDIAALDVRLKADSPLVNKGGAPASVAGREFPNPLVAPTLVPPSRQASATAAPRSADAALDIGAFEFGTGSTPAPGGNPGSSGGGPGAGPGGAGPAAGAPAAGSADDGCGCGVAGVPKKVCAVAGVAGLAALFAVLRRRRRAARND